RVARHLRDQIDIERVQRGFQPHARAGDGSLAASMPGSDHYDIEVFSELHREAIQPKEFPYILASKQSTPTASDQGGHSKSGLYLSNLSQTQSFAPGTSTCAFAP